MTTFPAYTKDELVERARNLLRARRRGIDLGEGSDYDLWSRILGALAWGVQKQAEGLLPLLDPRSAYGAFLDSYARETGIGRDLPGTSVDGARARGKVILLGTAGAATQPAGSVLQHADGTTYTLDADVTTSAPEAKTLYAGHQSERARLYQGHTGGGFKAAAVGEVYRATRTGELVALEDVDNHVALARYLFDLIVPLDEAPHLHDAFVKEPAAVGDITATRPGSRANKDPKDTLRVVSPATGIASTAHVLTLDGGTSPMSRAEMRASLRALYADRAPLGTLEDIRQVALAAGLSLRECYVTPDALGSYLLQPVRGDGAFVGAGDRAALLDFVRARFSPADHFGAQTVYEVPDTRIDVVSVQVSDVYAPDWRLPNESVRGVGLSAATSGTVTLATAAPDLAVGDRILLTSRGASGPYLVARRVTDIAGQTLTLDLSLPYPPDVAQSFVTPGGALSDALLDALYGAYAARAPSRSPLAVRYPSSAGSDAPEAVVATLSRLEGVLDVAFQPGAAPDLSTPGGMLVPACVVRMYV